MKYEIGKGFESRETVYSMGVNAFSYLIRTNRPHKHLTMDLYILSLKLIITYRHIVLKKY